MTLVEFLTARLDKDEQAARAATPGPWRWINAGSGILGEQPVLESESDPTTVVIDATGNHTEGYVCINAGDQAHIARHDPARVLRRVEPGRRLVQEYTEQAEAIARSPYPDAWDVGRMEGLEIAVRLRASEYDDHPDYDEAWRP